RSVLAAQNNYRADGPRERRAGDLAHLRSSPKCSARWDGRGVPEVPFRDVRDRGVSMEEQDLRSPDRLEFRDHNGMTFDIMPSQPQRDSNPCLDLERVVS